jgi:hypothetical protein
VDTAPAAAINARLFFLADSENERSVSERRHFAVRWLSRSLFATYSRVNRGVK